MNLLDFNKIKVVIFGQDPYYQRNRANGLAFSVSKEMKIPASLKNIFKEIKFSLGIDNNCCGELSPWLKGVLLLNTKLTTRVGKANSHSKIGWKHVTNYIIKVISKKLKNIVFILWGNNAKKLKKYIENKNNHYILETSHPSPLSVHKGFMGCNHFKLCNEYLEKHDIKKINWKN